MKSDTWMPFYVADYLRDTMHLSTELHGAYLLLLMGCWTRGGSLPDDDTQLSLTCRMPVHAWKKARVTLASFFDCSDGKWTNGRVVKELARAALLSEARREAGKKGGRPSVNPQTNSFAVGLANAKQNETHAGVALPLQDLTGLQSKVISEPIGSSEARGASKTLKTRPSKSCSIDWYPTEADFAVGYDAGMSPETIDKQLAMFRDYEFKTPKSNWSGAFRNWLRRSQELSSDERFNPNRANGPNRGPTVTDARRYGAALALDRNASSQGGRDDDAPGSSGVAVLRFRGAETG